MEEKQVNNRDEQGKFLPGVSGNPNGRPKDEDSPTYWLKRFLDKVDPKSKEGRKRIEDIAIRLAIAANKGEAWAIKEIFNRLDGKATQTIKHKGEIETGAKEVAAVLQEILAEDDEKENQSNKNDSK